jgi:hypothetical protein
MTGFRAGTASRQCRTASSSPLAMPDHETGVAEELREARRSRQVSRRLLAVVLGVVALSGISAAPALASNWTVTQLPGTVGSVPTLASISCPSPSLCVAVGKSDVADVATSTDPALGASAWTLTPIEGTKHLRAVSCPTVSLCVAVSPDGQIVTSTNPTAGPAAWSAADFGSAYSLNGVSCTSAPLCVAVGIEGEILTSTDPTAGVSAWTGTKLAESNEAEPGRPGLRAVSCLAGPLCVAVDASGEAHVSTNPTGGTGAWKATGSLAGLNSTIAISCPSLSLCVTGDTGNIIISTNPTGGASSWHMFGAGAGFQFTGFSCPSSSHCAAVDNDGDVLVSNDPTGGEAAWQLTKVIPGANNNGLHGVSCPAVSLCVAAGFLGTLVTSTEPFAPESHPTPAAVQTLRRPKARITVHPRHLVRFSKRGATVRFRFRAIGRASEFRCKLDRSGFKPCKSPKRYRVAASTHVFKVEAVGPTELVGRVATFRFKVARK